MASCRSIARLSPLLPLCSGARCVFISGSYFANHFIMGGEKFDSTHPEGYLFGENSDLNFLGNRPVVVGTGGARGVRSTGTPLPKPLLALCVVGCAGQGCWLSPCTGRASQACLQRAEWILWWLIHGLGSCCSLSSLQD